MRISRLRIPTTQTVVGIAVIGVTAAFVIYPIYYLLQASLDVGEPEIRPPTEYGLRQLRSAAEKYSGDHAKHAVRRIPRRP